MGYADEFLILEGDHIKDISSILKIAGYTVFHTIREVRDITEAGAEAHRYTLNGSEDVFTIGLSNGWTFLKERSLGMDYYRHLEKISSLINARLFFISIETHCESYVLEFWNKGKLARGLTYNDGDITKEGEEPLPMESGGELKEPGDVYLYKIISHMTHVDWARVLNNMDVMNTEDLGKGPLEFDRCIVLLAK